uniref:Uncharacterized protein n=1 Tax=Tanacetum cinerariifolium TaxID=118510 RepID=A0A6L2JN13_TANCI|nr:hypothetical protein [Tanacetum cinerariifolium]
MSLHKSISKREDVYFKYSNGLIRLKKRRGRVVKVGKTIHTTQKPTKLRKKPTKKKQVLRDESPKSEGELEKRNKSKLVNVKADLSTRLEAQGSTDEETNKDKNEDDDEDDVIEKEEDEEESVSEEENVNEKNEKESNDDDKSFDITNTDDERTESDSDNHEMPKEGETVAETKEEGSANSEHEEEDTKGEDHKTKQEPKGDDQAKEAKVGAPALVINKEKSEFLQSTSSHSISSNLGNQFLANSPNASFIGTILENIDKEINSLMDIKIQQDEPFHEVKVSVIPEPIQQPPSTPPLPANEDPAALVINFKAIDSFVHIFYAFQKDVHELKQADPSAAIRVSIRSQVPFIVKDSLRSNIGDELQKHNKGNTCAKSSCFSSILFSTPILLCHSESLTEFELKKILIEKMKRSKLYRTADQHKILYDGLVNSYLLDKDLFESYGQTVSLKRNHEDDQDEDPSTGPNQGKESKKRRTRKESESSKKSLTPKESTKDDADVPHIDPKPRIPKPDWFPQPPRPETPELD